MEYPESYDPRTILIEICVALYDYDKNLRVKLPSNNVTCKEALSAVLECINGLPDQICLPTKNLIKREAIRREARLLKTIPHSRILTKEDNTNTEEHSVPSSRPIRSNESLKSTDLPGPITPDVQAILEKQLLSKNGPPKIMLAPFPSWGGYPYELTTTHRLRTESTLASIVGNARLTSINWNDSMPQFYLEGATMFWHTGASSTIITTDILSENFRSHLSNTMYNKYIDRGRIRVQLSLTLEFTNTLFTMDTLAWAVPKDMVPDLPSGVILGQSGCIDRIQYRSVPRAILEAKGEEVDPSVWGDFILERFVDVDGSVKEIR